jgi:xylulokinase
MPLSCQADNLTHETDPHQWIDAFFNCAERFKIENNNCFSKVEAVVLTGNGPSLVPVFDEAKFSNSGLTIDCGQARLWLDRRAKEAAKKISGITDSFIDVSFFLPKALDIKINSPNLFDKTKCFLGCPEFLAYVLTGEARTVFPADGFEKWFWNNELLEKLNLDKEKFPSFILTGEVYGYIQPAAANYFGIKTNIPVISGGADFIAAILGTGIIVPGQVCDRAGSSEGINVCTENKIHDERLMSYSHPIKPFWNLSGIISTSGKAIEWAKNLLNIENFDDFFTLADSSKNKDANLIFLPYLAGERSPIWNPQAKAIMQNMDLSSGRSDFAKAVLEGICFAVKDVLSVMEETGVQIKELRIAGSAINNDIINQLKADITGQTIVTLTQKDSEHLGLAIIGAHSMKKYSSAQEIIKKFVKVEKKFYPNKIKTDHYNELFVQYKKTQENLIIKKS